MSATYSGDPSASDLDHIRFVIGDTDVNDPLLQDGELNYCLSRESSFYGACALACESIGNRFSQEADVIMGTAMQLKLNARAQQWMSRAQDYRQRAVAAHAPESGGMSKAQKEQDFSNPDRTGPYFRKDMEENRWLY